MEKIISGLAKFKNSSFDKRKELFATLANGQSPEVLLITCADSRIDPNLITHSEPGELFICRNAGNIVPPFGNVAGGMTASIEFGVSALGIEHIIICGHTDCGAMKGAMKPESLDALPSVASWLSHTHAAIAAVKGRHGKLCDDHLAEVTEQNVVLQMTHLETHPAVAAKLASGDVEIHGWVYDIAAGSVRAYDATKKAFVPVEDRYYDLIHNQKSAVNT
ncbi:MAG: carbonic anhydrase [SAR86 cluster bacterium]|uniref:Carbonic anhydrase n=1 Tax=SAR86 cluster bacterium TaxID=2030880 RepID=A0A2A5CC87_9GAMM|nr:MAG: carbonic anhydrase [SAR86 cluster bacterium]